MTPDQAITRRGAHIRHDGMRRRHPAEFARVQELSPFPHNTRLMYHGLDAGWAIKNDGILITLQKDSPTADPYFLREIVNEVVTPVPALGNIFSYAVSAKEGIYATCTLPTVDTANRFSQAMFHDLPTAGIRLIQTNDSDTTPVDKYFTMLNGRKLAVSKGPERYLHDLSLHFLGSSVTREDEFELFRTLGRQSDEIGRLHGQWVKEGYITRLAHGFEVFSDFIVRELMDEDRPPITNTLPNNCLTTLTADWSYSVDMPPIVIKQAQEMVNDLTIRDKSKGKYYDEIRNRLKTKIWLPR